MPHRMGRLNIHTIDGMGPEYHLTDRFSEALTFAATAHREQVRKGTPIPYIAHLIQVAGIVLDYGGDEDEAIAALLHDAPEDQGGRPCLEEIRKRFGDTVAGIVEACSDTLESPKPEWRRRKEEYIERLPQEPPLARLVSAADKLHNARTVLMDLRVHGDQLFERFNGKKAGTLWYYRALVGAFRATGTNPELIDELDRVVSELEKRAGVVGPAEPRGTGNGR
jgi:GTP pyrophosphokinase